ncbi:hypothetical protein LPB67_12905 [Undibacterium sp. Jales W-56]|uniref:hypothetical protein n=1 Tax=Undibacterium sp. Jales W-56 TaxID=2897325 RepID=UPI0021CE5A1C|nr:hypothetical protein [Undibacterium sp. Jales W-56]MCU6434669.1 hypothetical protein [Undibacterium sp. Jales W-56]
MQIKTFICAFAVALSLSACVSTSPLPKFNAKAISPVEAIQLAAAAPNGVAGTFALRVKATGMQDNRVYLNSESDYRDQRNLSIEITPEAAAKMTKLLGADPLVELKGKQLRVVGTARRVTVYFFIDGKRTDKYYYQTHVLVSDPTQIMVEN